MLKGPADADHYRVKVGRYNDRWYTDPLSADATWEATPDDESYPSISTVKKGASGADWTYVSFRRAAQKYAGTKLPDFEETYAGFISANKNGLKRDQQRGTGVHTLAEGRLTGYVDPMHEPNSDAEQYRGAVDAFFDTYQPELVACEFVAFHRDLNGVGYGGTGDAVVRIDGKNYLVDWKSRGENSDHGAYPEEASQVAAYARAQYWIVDGPRRIEPVTLAGGLIVSIKPDGFRVYPVDIDKAFEHWQAMHAWWCARRTERQAVGRAWAPRKVETEACSKPNDSDESPTISKTSSSPSTPMRTTPTEASKPPSPSSESLPTANGSDSKTDIDSIRLRIRSLPPEAKPHLQRLWPADTPRGPSGPFTDEQLVDIAKTLDAVEWEYTNKDVTPCSSSQSSSIPTSLEESPSSSSEQAWKTPEEGPDVDLTDVKARITSLTKEQQEQFNLILKQSKDAGRSFHLLRNRKGIPSLRRVTIVNALVDAIEASDGDEELLRHMLGFALGEEVQPAVALGCAVGSLTTLEAEKLALLAVALGHNEAYLDLSSGSFKGTAAVVAA